MDSIEVARISDFLRGLRATLRADDAKLLASIAASGELSDDDEKKLRDAIAAYHQAYAGPSEPAVPGAEAAPPAAGTAATPAPPAPELPDAEASPVAETALPGEAPPPEPTKPPPTSPRRASRHGHPARHPPPHVSVQNTRKITKAMEMVAAAKLRRAQQRIEALRPYAVSMVEMMQDLARYAESPGKLSSVAQTRGRARPHPGGVHG